MDQRIIQFVAALRSSGVRVSLAETEDAFHALQELGIQDKEIFRVALRASLVKDARELPAFDQLFPLFFQGTEPPPMVNGAEGMSPEDANKLAQALHMFADNLRRTLQKLVEGRPLTPDELRQMEQLTGLGNITDMRYQNWMARQMEQALNFKEVRQALEELLEVLKSMGMDRQRLDELRQAIQANQQALQEQIRQYSGQRIAENLSAEPRQENVDNLLNRSFSHLSEDDLHALRREVRRLAAALRTRLALRLKRSRGGQLDVKGTLRANLKNGSVPIELRHRDHTLKPKIVVVCDISTSMRHVSELMLSLLYSIQDQISKTHAFAFVDHLEYISPQLDRLQSNDAIEDVLIRLPAGHYNTDLGASLQMLEHDYLNVVDRRSTFIVVGDGRNNYNDPRLDLFKRLAHRSRSMIWLNPEAAPLWGTGDSDMLKYAPLCTRTFQVSNMSQLSAAIDHFLTG